MKQLITVFVFTGLLISCNSSDKSKTTNQESTSTEIVSDSATQEIKKQFKAIATDADVIATSLMAAPKESRSGAKVIGYNSSGELVTLKEGDNEFIVLADDPRKDGFHAACYHKDLEPFMARGRALRAEGKSAQEIFDIREEEMKAGKLNIETGLTLHIYYGPKIMYDPETLKVEEAQLRYVVYMPWATAASTGLPEAPMASNHPWIMNPGTHRAHIMISPLPETNE